MLPVLSHLGYGMNWKEAIVLAWGGLRGAVGLALALFVSLDNQIADARFTTLTFFYIAAIVLLTLLIQGTTTPLLLQVCIDARPSKLAYVTMHQPLQETWVCCCCCPCQSMDLQQVQGPTSQAGSFSRPHWVRSGSLHDVISCDGWCLSNVEVEQDCL